MSAIKVGDTFTHVDYPRTVFVARAVEDDVELGASIATECGGYYRADGATKVTVTIRPVKMLKTSELRAWHRSHTEWHVASVFAGGVNVWVRSPNYQHDASGPTEAKAILALRKALRAKGVTL